MVDPSSCWDVLRVWPLLDMRCGVSSSDTTDKIADCSSGQWGGHCWYSGQKRCWWWCSHARAVVTGTVFSEHSQCSHNTPEKGKYFNNIKIFSTWRLWEFNFAENYFEKDLQFMKYSMLSWKWFSVKILSWSLPASCI